jgi:hypothetical protein
MPYPYTTPTPPAVAGPLDGTWLRVTSIRKAGGVPGGLPTKCFRCIPYRITPGVSTLVIYRGAYYVDHQLSGFESQGHIEIQGHSLTLFNDPNCTSDRGTYRWTVTHDPMDGHDVLTLTPIDDACPFSGERADDLSFGPWERVNPCIYRIRNLWPSAIAC